MTSGIEFNKSYNSSYIMVPLQKAMNGMSATSSDKNAEARINAKGSMSNLDEIRQADLDKNNILSLEELQKCENKSDFLKNLEKAMEKFNSNKNHDYSQNLFEYWV